MLNGPPGGDVIHEEVDVNGHHACLEGHAYPSATEDGFEAGPCPDNFTFTVMSIPHHPFCTTTTTPRTSPAAARRAALLSRMPRASGWRSEVPQRDAGTHCNVLHSPRSTSVQA